MVRLFGVLCLGWFSTVGFAAEQNVPPDSSRIALQSLIPPDTWFAKDKADHFITSAFLVGFGYYMIHKEMDRSVMASQNIAAGFSFSLGISKEIYDGVSRKGQPSYKDLIADLAGIALGYLAIRLSSR